MRKIFTAMVALSLLLSLNAFSQSTNATVGGTVQDATGAFIPGVSVTATNKGTGIVTTVVTNEAGAYQFASLQPGSYEIKAELPGFQAVEPRARVERIDERLLSGPERFPQHADGARLLVEEVPAREEGAEARRG